MGLPLLLVGFAVSSSEAERAEARAALVKSRHSALARSSYQAADKRLIEFGWDAPELPALAQQLPEMQDSPFDGVGFRITHRMRAFEDRQWAVDEMQLPVLRELEWGNLDDSFLVLNGPGPTTMNWFDDDHWRTILRNMRLVSQAVDASRAAGLIFDPEFYLASNERSPWIYHAPTYPGHRPDQLKAKARQRGRQFVEALQSSVPRLRFLTLFAASHYCGRAIQSDDRFYLLIPFIKGMLDAGGHRFQLLDGHEASYNNRTPRDYLLDYSAVHGCSTLDLDLLKTAGTNPRRHWDSGVRMAPGIYMDYVMGTRPQHVRPFAYETRLRWLQSNAYWALESADRYAWFFSEAADWWRGDAKPIGVNGVPSGVETALGEARRLVREGLPLGYDLRWPRGVPLEADVAGPSVDGSDGVSLRARRHRVGPSSPFKVRVHVKGPDDEVGRVRLFVDATPIRTDGRPPFLFRFRAGLPPGEHDLLAQAGTGEGRATAGPLRLRVGPGD
jgi:hypothetical protein